MCAELTAQGPGPPSSVRRGTSARVGSGCSCPPWREDGENFFGVRGPVVVTLALPTGAVSARAVAVRYERGRAGAGGLLARVETTEAEGAAAESRASHIRCCAPAPTEGPFQVTRGRSLRFSGDPRQPLTTHLNVAKMFPATPSGYGSFHTAERTLEDAEVVHTKGRGDRKGAVGKMRLDGRHPSGACCV
jgi:hypothetical protein